MDKEETRLETTYWIGAILDEDWNEDNRIFDLLSKSRTGEILISKPVYHFVYGKKVRYISVSFFKVVASSYFGRGLILNNDIVPVIKSSDWKHGKKWKFCKLIYDLGKPDFYYIAGELKMACNNHKNKNK